MFRSSVFTLMLLAGVILAACTPSAPAAPTATAIPTAVPATVAPTSAPTTEPTTPPTAAATEAATSAPGVTPATGAAGPDAQAIVDAFRALGKTKGFRATMTIVGASRTLTQSLEAAPPDRFHFVMPAINTEAIIIGGDMYTKLAGAPWQKVNTGAEELTRSVFMFGDQAQVDKFLTSLTEVKSAGTEDLNGTPTKVYQFTQTISEAGTSGTNEVRLWIGQTDGLPHKSESQSTLVASGQTLTGTTTIDYTELNADVNIQPPTP